MGKLNWPVTGSRGCHSIIMQIGAGMAVQHFVPCCSEVQHDVPVWQRGTHSSKMRQPSNLVPPHH